MTVASMHRKEPTDKPNFFVRVFQVTIDTPFTFFRDITIPPSEDKPWNRTYVALTPIMGLLFTLYVTESTNSSVLTPIVFDE